MDELDRKIVNLLHENARLTNLELSKAINLSPSPCLRRVRNLEQKGIIRGYTAKIDPDKCGYMVESFIRISLREQNEANMSDFEDGIRKLEEVRECHLVTGQHDYMIRVICPDIKSYEMFIRNKLTRIPRIAAMDSSIVLNTIVDNNKLPPLQHNES